MLIEPKKLLEILAAKGISRRKIARWADISEPDIYMIMSCKKVFFPGWRKRIAAALQMSEAEVFPEFVDQKKGD